MHRSSIASLTPTLCRLFRVPEPALCSVAALEEVEAGAETEPGTGGIDRCLVYCPDALGDHLWSHYPDQADLLTAVCPQRVGVVSVLPPKTPVCFASMFTGAMPEQHGIRRYERPVLRCDTLFDALIRAGRHPAIVAVRDSSVDLIFRGREIDYFSESYDSETQAKALELLLENRHDLIVVYHQEYDDQLHETEPYSPSCIQAMRNHVASFQAIAAAAGRAWSRQTYAMVIAPDHGAHLDAASGRGDHGLAIPEDLDVSHWYGRFSPEQ